MKFKAMIAPAILALCTLTASASFASAPHCPPGEENVWGACFEKGAGVFNPIFNHPAAHTGHAVSAPHCRPPLINVWGACVLPAHWGHHHG